MICCKLTVIVQKWLCCRNVSKKQGWSGVQLYPGKKIVPKVQKLQPKLIFTSSITLVFSSYIWCVCGVALFHFVLSYLPLVNPSQRKNDSRFVAETSSAWVHSLIHLSKIENKKFFEKKPLTWREAKKRELSSERIK